MPKQTLTDDEFIEQMTVGTLPADAQEGTAEEAFRALVEGGQGFLGLEPGRKGTEAYRTGQALSNLPMLAIPAAAVKAAPKVKGAVEDVATRAVRRITENPDLSAVDIYNAMFSKQAPGVPITTYHGSGNLFQQLDASKAGSGVGGQRYGAGAGYTAESRDLAEAFGKQAATGQAYLYKGEIPDAIVPSFLDWNKKLGQQTDEIKALLMKDPLVKESTKAENWNKVSNGIIQKSGDDSVDAVTGNSVYDYIALKLGSQDAATEYLNKLGVRGIRYADPGSKERAATGTSNFLVFNPADYRIESVNDMPVGKGPEIKKSGRITELEKRLKEEGGLRQAQRLQRAADEIPGLENQYQSNALMRAFLGRKGYPYQGVMTMKPEDFEQFALPLGSPLSQSSKERIEKLREVLAQGGVSLPTRFPSVEGAFDDVPFLMMDRKDNIPFIAGHEGRHRMRALSKEGYPTTLVEVYPRSALEMGGDYESLTATEWLKRFNEALGKDRLVVPEDLDPALSTIKRNLPETYAEGGEVSNEDFIEQMTVGTRPTDQEPRPYDQTAAAQFADYLRAPVDLAQTAVRGTIGAVVGPAYGLYKGVTGGKYGTPEGVREASSEAGELMQKITGEPQSKAAKDFLQFINEKAEALKLAPMPQLMTAPLPGRGAVRFQGEAAKGAVEDIALRAVRSQTENPDITAAQLYNAMLGKQAPGAAAVKPRGGIALTTQGSPLGNYIEDVIKAVNQDNYRTTVPEDKRAEVADFIAKKMPKYISRDFGTENDPIRQAVLEGRINLFGRDKERLRKYALTAARADDPEALEDITRAYDRGTGLRPYLITPDTEDYRVTRDAKDKAVDSLVQKMVAEGADENTARSIVSERLEGIALKDLEAASREDGDIRSNFGTSAQILAAFGGKDQTDFIRRAVEQGDVAYGMSTYNLLDMFDSEAIAKTIGAVPLEKLSRMSFPEAFIEGTNVLKLTRDFDAAVETARRGKGSTLPKEVLSFGTKPLSESTSGKWVQITDPNAARLEGALMGHSVGGYGEDGNYNLGGKKALLSGKANLFSLRDEKGLPIATVEMEDMGKREGGAPDLKVKQVQARYNSAPEDYLDDVFKLAKEVNGRWPTGPAGVQRYMTDRTGKGLEQPVEIRWNDLYLRYLQSQEPDKKAAGGEVTKFIQAHA